MLIIVGGPQYRAGSHRQFTLLSRYIAESGNAAMRFDHRGIGDSDGSTTFEDLDSDIRAAIDELQLQVPCAKEIVLWGLCDAASAAMMYADSDERVCGLVLLNPWARSEQTLARSYLRSYYLSNFLSIAFWRRLLGGKVSLIRAMREFASNIFQAASRRANGSHRTHKETAAPDAIPFTLRMERGLRNFTGPALFVLSGNDITAREFETMVSGSRAWQSIMQRQSVTVQRLSDADHTFSKSEWTHTVEKLTRSFMN